MKMDLDFEDGARIVKSLTSKVMSIIGKLQISSKLCLDDEIDNARVIKPFTDDVSVQDEQSFAGLYGPTPPGKVDKSEHKSYQIARRTTSSREIHTKSKQLHKSEVISGKNPMKDTSTYSNHICEQLSGSFNKSSERDLQYSGSLSLSTSYSMYVLNKSRAKLLNTGLGLSESLRKIYINCSLDSQNHSVSASPRLKSSINVTDQSYFHPEKFRQGSDTDSTRSLSSSNFSKGTNCDGFITDNSNLYGCSSDSDDELVKIRYDTTSSSVDNTFNNSDLNEPESPFGTRSITEEFRHDIDYLAKSAYRTSTPDLSETTGPVDSLETGGAEFKITDSSEKTESKNSSRNSFSPMTDSLAVLSRKYFVHGLSPLCSDPVSTHDSHSSSPVRRSLVFVSPSKNVFLFPKSVDENVSDSSPEIQTSRFSCSRTTDLVKRPDIRFSEELILPKFMFRDETDEAVYYLKTKYLENSLCKW